MTLRQKRLCLWTARCRVTKMLTSCSNVFDSSKILIACRHHLVPVVLSVAEVAEVLVAVRSRSFVG